MPDTVKPRFRGWLHQRASFVAVPAGCTLVVLSKPGWRRFALAVYAVSLAGLFISSAVYHRGTWSPRARRWLRSLDHSMIYLLIAGTYTAFGALALDGAWRTALLTIVWCGATTGIVLKLIRIEGWPRLGGALYIVLGWALVLALPGIVHRLGPATLSLTITGGVLYTTGAVVLLRRRPDPRPTVFGYHEIWHSFVVAASACHYAAILMLARSAG